MFILYCLSFSFPFYLPSAAGTAASTSHEYNRHQPAANTHPAGTDTTAPHPAGTTPPPATNTTDTFLQGTQTAVQAEQPATNTTDTFLQGTQQHHHQAGTTPASQYTSQQQTHTQQGQTQQQQAHHTPQTPPFISFLTAYYFLSLYYTNPHIING